MDIYGLINLGAGILIPTGVSSIARAFVAPKLMTMKPFEKVCALVATSAVSGYVATNAVKHVTEEVNTIKLNVDQLKKGKEEEHIIIVKEDDHD